MKLLVVISVFLAFQITHTQNFEWYEQQSGVTSQLNSITNPAPFHSNFWICGNNRIVLWTNNLGDDWLNISSNLPIGINLTSISAIDTNTAVTAGNIGANTYIYKTTNKGQIWNQVFYQEGGYIISISKNADYIIGNPASGRWSIWRSSNSGSAWDSSGLYLHQNGNEHGWNNSVSFIGSSIWIGTNNFRIYYYNNDSGWQIQTMPEQNIYAISSTYFSSELFAGGNQLYRTTDNGISWNQIPSPGSGEIRGIAIPIYIIPLPLKDNIYYDLFIARSNREIYSIHNNSTNIAYTAGSGSYTSLFGSVNGIYGIRDNGGITAGFLRILVGFPPSNYPYSFELKQNFPNPFNPTTRIPVTIYKSTNLNISIYNIAGEFITTLFNGNLNPLPIYDNSDYYSMSHYFEWDASNYPCGVYFYQVTADDYKETRKMMLIK